MRIKNFFENIFFISLLLFLIKLFFFIKGNQEIDFLVKFILEIEDWQYFPLIFNLSNLDFNPSYNPNLISLKYLPLPIYSILYHAIFLNFFDIYGFIIIEFFIILLFSYILFNFFIKLGIKNIQAVFLTLFLFCLPDIINYFQLYKIQYVGAIKELYNLRIPRPSITHLYLFSFFLLLVTFKKNTQFKYYHLALIGSFFAFMWGSFYYNLVISGVAFIFYYFFITYKSNQKTLKYIIDFFVVLIFFSIFSIPIILIILNSEPNYLTRVGLTDIDYVQKKILLVHFIKILLSIKFIILFVIITMLYFYLKVKKVYKIEGLNLLYFIFLSSFLGPLIFILISPTISEPYHFTNMIISLTFFVLLIFLFLLLNNIFSRMEYFFRISILFLLFFYVVNNYSLAQQKHSDLQTKNFTELVKEIKKVNLKKNAPILTFDDRIQTYLILDGHINLTNVSGIYTPITDVMMENRVISIFQFLNLGSSDFNNFIKNEKRGWRFINPNIARTFYTKYQANRLTTYQNSKDFTSEELNYILKSSPLHSQQLIIPAFEIKRLIDKFVNFKENEKIKPNLIIININDIFTKNLTINDSLYCSKKINESYMIYFIKKNNLIC